MSIDVDPHGLLERVAGPTGFTDQVLARVAHAAGEGGGGWDQALDRLLEEMQEEAADIGGWALGAEPHLTETERHRLVVAVKLGAAAWRELEELRTLVAQRPPGADLHSRPLID